VLFTTVFTFTLFIYIALTLIQYTDLIQSELAGLAFDSLQQVFRKADIKIAMAIEPMPFEHNNTIFVVIDPAAGGPQSDYAVVSLCRSRGNITVSDTKLTS
jgi:hypothetical protein